MLVTDHCYDIYSTYDDDGNPNCTCSGNTIDSDQYSGLWAWVSNASYAGQEDMFDQKVNLWQALVSKIMHAHSDDIILLDCISWCRSFLYCWSY
jgi:hypothetical protein